MLSITYPRQQLLRREPGQVTARSPRCFSASRLIEFTPVPGVNVRAIMETRRWKKKEFDVFVFFFFTFLEIFREFFFFNSFHGGWLLCWGEKRITALVHGFLFSDCLGIVYSSSLERRSGYKRFNWLFFINIFLYYCFSKLKLNKSKLIKTWITFHTQNYRLVSSFFKFTPPLPPPCLI